MPKIGSCQHWFGVFVSVGHKGVMGHNSIPPSRISPQDPKVMRDHMDFQQGLKSGCWGCKVGGCESEVSALTGNVSWKRKPRMVAARMVAKDEAKVTKVHGFAKPVCVQGFES